MKKQIMTGDEAAARGAYEAGCNIAAAYPGTPSTEILENIARYREIKSKWASNEKVALEIAAGASIGGARSLAAMKHVGLNVAADPLFTMGYAGVNGGLVVVSADDPGCHSSQNEQDNRLYAVAAKLALVEPSDSQECKDYMIEAFDISERFDIPVLFRMTTRVCHSKSLVALGERADMPVKAYVRNPGKYAMLPGTARNRHAFREASMKDLKAYANATPLNRVEWNADRKLGVITSGISYQYAREVLGEGACYLKLGFTNPMPDELIRTFAQTVQQLFIVEEGEPFIENHVRTLGFSCVGKEKIPILGELSTAIVRRAILGDMPEPTFTAPVTAPSRPPVLCAGCPHRGYFYSIMKHKKRLVPVGDIGCYALGMNPPFEGFDYSICMGAGMSSVIGLSEALTLQGDTRKAVGMVGDSTFFHSGIQGLIDAVHYSSNVVLCVLDNSITAMTGHQENTGTRVGLMQEPVRQIDLLNIIRATGLGEDRIRVVDPVSVKEMDAALDDALAVEGPFVIVTKSPCVLIKEVARKNAGCYVKSDPDKCKHCKACLRIACPALSLRNNVVYIDPGSCAGCGLCMQLCKFGAMERVSE